ncbi:hypothetical protein LIX60_17480 [Streptomyces sp. S07_1.15]|nr:hypothetical protein [Streptomyces sp. S07_1.15]MCC3653221.1 hypothetical protein [Streptomyces sp. S07_1.15]
MISAALWLVAYTALCMSQPFTPAGKPRLGRRLLNWWRRNRDAGTR